MLNRGGWDFSVVDVVSTRGECEFAVSRAVLIDVQVDQFKEVDVIRMSYREAMYEALVR